MQEFSHCAAAHCYVSNFFLLLFILHFAPAAMCHVPHTTKVSPAVHISTSMEKLQVLLVAFLKQQIVSASLYKV